jgi:hypothetical protein
MEYRLTYVIERREDANADFAEVGFGSSGAAGTIDAALYEVEATVQNKMWETSAGMPAPDDA